MSVDLSMYYTKDEDGNDVEVTRPETKSWEEVVQVAKFHVGKNEPVVDAFITMYTTGLQWDWFADYKQWKAECVRIEAINADIAAMEVQKGETRPEPLPLPAEPLQHSERSVQSVREVYPEVFGYSDPVEQRKQRMLSDTLELIETYREQKELGVETDITLEQYKQALMFREQLRKM